MQTVGPKKNKNNNEISCHLKKIIWDRRRPFTKLHAMIQHICCRGKSGGHHISLYVEKYEKLIENLQITRPIGYFELRLGIGYKKYWVKMLDTF